jgi:uncharacterized protein (UPF0335 family)
VNRIRINKEVEDALHMLLHCSLKDKEYETQKDQFRIVHEYIEKLETACQDCRKDFNDLYKESKLTIKKWENIAQREHNEFREQYSKREKLEQDKQSLREYVGNSLNNPFVDEREVLKIIYSKLDDSHE